jgi:hypothetical protein
MQPAFLNAHAEQFIDLFQSIAILVALFYITNAFRQSGSERKRNEDRLTEVLKSLQEVHAGMERAWTRIDEIETHYGIRGDVNHIAQLHRVIDAMQVALRVHPNDNSRREK